MDIEAVIFDLDTVLYSKQIGEILDNLYKLNIKIGVVCHKTLVNSIYIDELKPLNIFEFIITPEDIGKEDMCAQLYYEAQWKMNVNKKKALVVTTNKEQFYCAVDAFCRAMYVDDARELTALELDNILNKNCGI